MRSNIKLYGPEIPKALTALKKLIKDIEENNQDLKDAIKTSGNPVIGNVDFYFTWQEAPDPNKIMELVTLIDKNLSGLKTKYTLSTENVKIDNLDKGVKKTEGSFSFLKFYGPSISEAIDKLKTFIDEESLIKEGSLAVVFGEEADVGFEWLRPPAVDEIIKVIDDLDKVIASTNVLYTITTKTNIKYLVKDYKLPNKKYEKVMRIL